MARMRPELPRLAAGALFLGITNALGMAIPWLLRGAIDALTTHAAAALAQVTRAALFILALAAAQAVIRTASRVVIFNAGRNIEYSLRRELFNRLTLQPPSFYQTQTVGDVMSRLTNDLGAVRMLFGPGVLNIVNTAIVYGTGVCLLWSMSPRLTTVALLPFPLIVLFGRLSTRRLYRTSRDVQDQLGTMSTTIVEDLAGIATLHTYGLESLRRERFDALNTEYFGRSLRLVRARGLLMPVFALIAGGGTLIVLWMGGREVIAGRMSVGTLVAFNAYLVYLSWPTLALGWVMALWQRGIAGWVRVREILDREAPADRDDKREAPGPAIGSGALRIRNLSVERGGRQVLDQVSLDIAPGQTVAIAGRTGSGKSTLLDALLGFVAVPPGTIFIGGRDAAQIPLRRLRRFVGYAPQEAFLFSATVAENIAFGKHDAADHDIHGVAAEKAIRAAADTAGLARDLAVLPDGLDTLVGERGITLSGGQRQRVALARALYADPQVLILDDSLSAVDAETERDILARLAPVLRARQRTTLMVSHRVAAVRNADRIIVMDGGRVAEVGTHDQLLAACGVYASIYEEQGAAA